ncbi:peptidoglycan DD-metalloendopeptidase family protein [Streptomyces sp. NPDC091272]|uniref:peptidoglycan DD-metalloendopeptidase family protein n=1 Tax=Streptomyces sp. NPDC091272 TaxID=3365981 RepID=UPI0037FC573F
MYRPVITALFTLLVALSPRLAPTALAEAGHDRAWPVGERPAVVRGWEPPPSKYAAGHRGVDLAARPGDEVRAAAAGRISFAGRVAGRGVLSITLPASGDPPLRTTYEPVRPVVAEGDEVKAGQLVGVLEPGAGHCLPESCLHWGLVRGDEYLDPLSLLPPELLRSKALPRLLPVWGVPAPEPAPPAPAPRPVPAPAPPPKVAALAPDALHGLALSVAAVLAYRIRGRRGRGCGSGGPKSAGVRRMRGRGVEPGRGPQVSPGRRAGPSRRPPR